MISSRNRKPLEGYVEVDFRSVPWDLTVFVPVEEAGDSDDSAIQAARAMMDHEGGFDPTGNDNEDDRRVHR